MTEENSENLQKVQEHHIQQELCTSRLPYRQGRKLTAVKVYSICNESQHLMIYGVPTLNIQKELKTLLKNYGEFKIEKFEAFETEPFTETYHVVYERIQAARICKRILDTHNFYGGLLHICYAPEFETLEQTRKKFEQRKKDVLFRLKKNQEIRELAEKEKSLNYNSKGNNLKRIADSMIQTDKKFPNSEIGQPSFYAPTGSQPFCKRVSQDGGDCEKDFKIRKMDVVIEKQFEPTFLPDSKSMEKYGYKILADKSSFSEDKIKQNSKEFVPNMKFGNEEIRALPERKLNKIIFTINKNG